MRECERRLGLRTGESLNYRILEKKSNRQPFGAQDNAPLTEPHQPGWFPIFISRTSWVPILPLKQLVYLSVPWARTAQHFSHEPFSLLNLFLYFLPLWVDFQAGNLYVISFLLWQLSSSGNFTLGITFKSTLFLFVTATCLLSSCNHLGI